MSDPTNHPALLFVLSFIVLLAAARAGMYFREKRPAPEDDWREGFGVVQAATLTLLGLMIGFTFSMATSRYDQRKNYEEAEANAIGTAYVRADLLPDGEGAKVRSLLRRYLDERLLFYRAHDEGQLESIDARTARLQDELWSVVRAQAAAQATPVVTLVLAGMNDVFNSQGYTQAAWWNRIPTAAWALMATIAILCNLLVGYGSSGTRVSNKLLLVLPLVVSVSFMLIADIDAPRYGIIRVSPHNLEAAVRSVSGR